MVTENKQRNKSKKPKKVNNLRYAEYYDMQETFDGLYAKAKDGGTFDQLIDLIFNKAYPESSCSVRGWYDDSP